MLDINEIQKVNPHRYPFSLLDKVIEVEPQKRIVAIKNVTINEPFFQGHFPGKPVMPGVLIVEAMAQACSFAAKYQSGISGVGVFTGIENCKFRRMVVPGDVLRIEVEITRLRSTMGKASGKAYVGDELTCEAEISFAIVRE